MTETFEERAKRMNAEMLYAMENGLQNIAGEDDLIFDNLNPNEDETEG